MKSITFGILSAFLSISMLSCGILSVLLEGMYDPEPLVCEHDHNCSETKKCFDNLCVDICTEVTCQLRQRCVYDSPHKPYCSCRKVYYSKPYLCVPTCHDNRDCEPSKECLPDKDNYYHCICRSDFIADPIFPDYACRYRCTHDRNCSSGSLCRRGMCFDFCNADTCEYTTELCLAIGKMEVCVTRYSASQLYGVEF